MKRRRKEKKRRRIEKKEKKNKIRDAEGVEKRKETVFPFPKQEANT